jgi:hypothetical protein
MFLGSTEIRIFRVCWLPVVEKWSLNSAAQGHLDSQTLQNNLMTKHRLSATSISSELDTVQSLQAKLAKVEAKKIPAMEESQ